MTGHYKHILECSKNLNPDKSVKRKTSPVLYSGRRSLHPVETFVGETESVVTGKGEKMMFVLSAPREVPS